MTREEAIKQIEKLKSYCEYMADSDESGAYLFDLDGQALDLALSALRPITREQVILCKDCRYWQGNNGGYPHPECRWGNDETPDADDYCSFAERMEVNKNC